MSRDGIEPFQRPFPSALFRVNGPGACLHNASKREVDFSSGDSFDSRDSVRDRELIVEAGRSFVDRGRGCPRKAASREFDQRHDPDCSQSL